MGSRKANTQPARRWGGGEERAARAQGARRGEVLRAAPGPAPRLPRARGAWRGGQLLYWHALRPEAGPCRPP